MDPSVSALGQEGGRVFRGAIHGFEKNLERLVCTFGLSPLPAG